jgi:ribosomal protein S18 acetylase RimI-like enzyme
MTVSLRLMPLDRLTTWIDIARVAYVADRMRSGESREVAEQNARQSDEANFPGGRPLPSHRIFEVVVGDEAVGVLWIAPRLEGSDQWWVYDLEIDEQHRRRGYARAALELGHAEAKALGATSIGLNVFAFNEGARELYESLGYAPMSMQLQLPLT